MGAGGFLKPSPIEQFMDTGKPVKDAVRVEAKPTDPITHFAHEGLNCKADWRTSKRSGYKTRAAAQSWTYAQDARVREDMCLFEDPGVAKMKYLLGADGIRRFNMWGGEDLLQGGKSEYIKCDQPPRLSNILRNDKRIMAYCMRDLAQKQQADQKREHHHGHSSAIWEVLRHEPSPSESSAAFKEYWKRKLQRLKEQGELAPSDDDPTEFQNLERDKEHRRLRPSRSVPPETYRGYDGSQRTRTSDSSLSDPSSSSYRGSSTSASQAPISSGATRSRSHDNGFHRSWTARGSISRDSASQERSTNSGRQKSSSRKGGDASCQNVTSRTPSEASLSMTPLSITNAMLAARHHDSTPRNHRRGP